MLTIIAILLVLALGGGGYYLGQFGGAGWSQFGILLLVLFILSLTSYLHR